MDDGNPTERYVLSTPQLIFKYAEVVIVFAASCSSWFMIAALFANPKIRKNGYNTYLQFLLIPDAFQSLFTALLRFYRTSGIHVSPPGEVFVFVWKWYYFSNFYLNLLLAYQIHRLVIQSYNRRRTRPPELSTVYKQVSAIYFVGLLFGLWGSLPVPWAIYHITNPRYGSGSLGSPEGGVFSSTFGMLVNLVLTLVPIAYVVYVRIRIRVKNLLPKKGRTRVLSLFFMRIIIVFLVFYLPGVILTMIMLRSDSPVLRVWIEFIIGLLTAGQTTVTVYMMSMKDDIRIAIVDFFNQSFGRCGITCKRRRNEAEGSTMYISGLSAPINKKRVESDKFSSGNRMEVQQPPTQMMPPVQQQVVSQGTETPESEWEQDDIYDEEQEGDRGQQDGVQEDPEGQNEQQEGGAKNNDGEQTSMDEEEGSRAGA